jgi:dTDP-4-amino-4,6-dideoxygalactose transaminase
VAPVGAVVPFVDLERQHAPLRAELEDAFRRVVGSSGFILGAEVEAFERDLAAYCGVEQCVGVASGTAAIVLMLTAAGIGPGDEVIVPGHTFVASALGVIHAGATPVLCDVNAGDGLIDATSAAAACGERTAAILAVHLYGQACSMEPLRELASRRGLALFEDAAQAHGALHGGDRAGALGDAAAFSFYPSKNLGALGDGGAVCTNDAALAERVRSLRHLGQQAKGQHVLLGYNERLDGLQAALLRVKLPHLDAWNDARRRLAARYRARLGAHVRIVEEAPDRPSIHHLFPVRVPDRDGLAAQLAQQGVEAGVHYSPALAEQPALDGRVRTPVELAESTAWAAEELSLPMFAEMREDELDRAAAACLSALATAGRA